MRMHPFDFLHKATKPIPRNEFSLSALQPESAPWDQNRPDLKDPATGYVYPYQSNGLVWSKHLFMLIPSMVFHTLAMPLLILSDWWSSSYYSLSALVWFADGCAAMGYHQLKSATSLFLSSFLKPFALVGILASHLIGLVAPQIGRKLYASLERQLYWTGKLIPSFQPYCLESCHDGIRVMEPCPFGGSSAQSTLTIEEDDDFSYYSCCCDSPISSYDFDDKRDLTPSAQYRFCPPESYEVERNSSMVVC